MKSSAAQTLRFTHLAVENWRNFARLDLPLAARAFLIGPNASGKSNFLDLFRFLKDIVSVGGGLEEAVRRRRGLSHLRCLAARENRDVELRVSIGTEASPERWQYELAINQARRKPPAVRCERVLKNGKLILERPDAEDRKDPARLTQTSLEQVHENREFREVAAFLSTIGYLHIVPQLVRHPDRAPSRMQDPYGSDLLERLGRTPERTRTKRLSLISAALRMAIPQLCTLEFWRDTRGAPHLRWRCEHWKPTDVWQTEEEFSDGTLRLLGVMWAALDGNGPLLLEEPELSLHPDVARFIPQMLARMQSRSGRQILISTHSNEMLADEGIGVDELLLFMPAAHGTDVRLATEFKEIRELMRGGVSLAEAAMPRTSPPNADQLSLFPD
jgi:predicted ATPase